MQTPFRVVHALIFLLSIFLSSAALSHGAANHDVVDNALTWLAKQQVNGAFTNSSSSANSWQASHEAVEALAVTKQLNNSDVQSIQHFFDAQAGQETELLARRIQVGLKLGLSVQNDLAELQQRQNIDGGFGSEAGFQSSVYDTLFALQVLANTGKKATPSVASAIGYLAGQQHSNGSFSINAQNESALYSTAFAVRVLHAYLYVFDVGSILTNAQNYLYAQVKSNAGWNSDWEAAQFLLAVIPLTKDAAKYEDSLTWLKLQQRENGSWQNDVFATALAIQAIYLNEHIIHPQEPNKALIKGRLLSADSQQPLQGVAVSIDAINSTHTDQHGEFVFAGLDAGQYTLVYELDGYQTLNQSLTAKQSQLIDVGDVHMPLLPTHAVIEGMVTDSETGLPISGATVVIEQNGEYQTVATDGQGYYQTFVSPEALRVTISHPEYQSAVGHANATAGGKINFSAQLYKNDSDDKPSLQIVGTLLDASTMKPIPAAKLQIQKASLEQMTNERGEFLLEPSIFGEVTIVLSKDGYKSISLNLLLPEFGVNNLGAILLQPDFAGTTKVQGQVTDANTGLPIETAKVNIDGLEALTDAYGYYSIEGIASEEFVVGVSAENYAYSSASVRANKPSLTVNLSMQPTDDQGVELVGVDTEQSNYLAYQPVQLSATVRNQTVRERQVTLYVLITDAQGQVLDRFPASDLPAPPKDHNAEAWAHYQQHVDEATERLMPSETRYIQLATRWNTGRQQPGDYSAIIQVLDAATSLVLAEQAAPFSIEPQQKIAEISAQLSPDFALVNSENTIQLSALLRNSSNQPIEGQMNWILSSPSNETVSEGSVEFTLIPEEQNKNLSLQSLSTIISESGDYKLMLSVSTVAEIAHINPAMLFVPPSARLIVEQDLTPQRLLPGQERQSQIRIQIKGVEDK